MIPFSSTRLLTANKNTQLRMLSSIFHLSLFTLFMVILLPARALFSQYNYYILGEKITLDEIEPPDNYELQVFMEEDMAIRSVFEGCDEVLVNRCVLDTRRKGLLEERLKGEMEEDSFNVFIGKSNGKICRYAIIIEERGCFHPITFIVGVEPDGRISMVAVTVYRESRGKEVVRERFLHQYKGKSAKDPIQLNRDIINITGATTSVRGVNRGVRKALAVLGEFYLHGNSDAVFVPYTKMVTQQTKDGLLNEGGQRIVSQAYFAMDDIIEVVIAGSTEKMASYAFKEVFKEVIRLEKILNKNIKNSELSRINKKAKKETVRCSVEIIDIIGSAMKYSKLTDGRFDITEGPLVDKFGKGSKRLSKPEQIESLFNAASYKNIAIDADAEDAGGGTIFIKERLTEIDLSLISRGYVIDRVVEILRGNGIANALVSYGDNIRVMGNPPGDTGWKIAIPNPTEDGKGIGFIKVRDMAIATSGDYEGMLIKNRKKYSGVANVSANVIIKRPFDTDLLDVIVIAPTAFEADAVAAAVFLSDMNHGMKLIENMPNVEAIDLYNEADGNVEIELSDGMKAYFTYEVGLISSQRQRPACAF